MRRVLWTLLTVALLWVGAAAAQADDAARDVEAAPAQADDAARDVEAAPAQADDASRVMELKRQIIEMQNNGSLGINDFTFCRKVLNYGTFIPWGDPVFPVGGEFVVYFEPLNWFTNITQGRYEFWMTQDFRLETVAGEVLFEKARLQDMHFNTAKPVLDVYMTNDFSLGQLPPGEYVFIVVLRDELKGHEFEARKNFTVE